MLKKKHVYQTIFRLPVLKFCKLFLGNQSSNEKLPLSSGEYSSIEHLIIEHRIYYDELHSLLSYVPQLRHLSLRTLFLYEVTQNQLSSFVLNFLTHLSLILEYSVKFDDLEQLLVKYFPFIQVLHISSDWACLDANKWIQLIPSYLPNLRIFDVQFEIYSKFSGRRRTFETESFPFRSSFWNERQ
ncbi:hypothetical protein I4U23_031432 [Adineta vaga]|nr:hypothetical protein I4U23_031432 [Adineta vaga]